MNDDGSLSPNPRTVGIPYAYETPLGRLCPVCEVIIPETYDKDGERITNNYADHYYEKHERIQW